MGFNLNSYENAAIRPFASMCAGSQRSRPAMTRCFSFVTMSVSAACLKSKSILGDESTRNWPQIQAIYRCWLYDEGKVVLDEAGQVIRRGLAQDDVEKALTRCAGMIGRVIRPRRRETQPQNPSRVWPRLTILQMKLVPVGMMVVATDCLSLCSFSGEVVARFRLPDLGTPTGPRRYPGSIDGRGSAYAPGERVGQREAVGELRRLCFLNPVATGSSSARGW